MVRLRIPRMQRVAQTRHTLNGHSYVFWQQQWTEINDPDDAKEFLEGNNRDIFEVDGEVPKAKPTTYTEAELYKLSGKQQDELIKKLGGDPKQAKLEKDKVELILNLQGGN